MATIKWYKSHFNDEAEEFQQLGRKIGLSMEDLRTAYNEQHSPKLLVQSMWAKLENTDSWRMKSYGHLASLLQAYQKPLANFAFLLDALLINNKCPLPILVAYIDKQGNQKVMLFAGNTRLSICRIAKIQPRVIFLDMIADD